MNNLSFDIKTTADFFDKLLDEYEDFKINPTSARIALNCAMTAWHLSEWAFHEYNTNLAQNFRTLGVYQQDLKNQCTSLQIMHDLANGTKHYQLTRHTPVVKHTNRHIGPFSRVFSRAFDVSYLNVELTDGTKRYFDDEIENTVNFWRMYLNSTFSLKL